MSIAHLSAHSAAASTRRAELKEEGCRRLLAALREVGAPLTYRRHDCGDTIYREGEEGAMLYVLTEGVAKLFASYAGNTGSKKYATFLLLGPPDLLGYPLFAGGLRRFSAEAVTECELVKVPRVFLKRAISRRTDVALDMATLLDLMLADYEEVIGCLSPRKTEVRLANMLQVLARKFGARIEGGKIAIGLRLTRTDLAEMIASTRESVTAVVTGMRRKGIITMENGHIVLLDPERLTAIGCL